MATKKTVKKDSKNSLVKKESTTLVSADMEADMLADAQSGGGFDNMNADDLAIPFISVLQAMSPQCRGEGKIAGAEEGMFFNSVTNELYGREIEIIPCAYRKAYVEWVPRDMGGGFVKEHTESSILDKCTKNEKGQDMLESGNQIVTTAYHYVLVVKKGGVTERAVIALTSTQLKKSRKWNSTMVSLVVVLGGKKVRPAMFSHSYEAKSVSEKNEYGSWAGWQIGSPTRITDGEIYATAKSFSQESSSVKLAVDSQEGGVSNTTEGDSEVI